MKDGEQVSVLSDDDVIQTSVSQLIFHQPRSLAGLADIPPYIRLVIAVKIRSKIIFKN